MTVVFCGKTYVHHIRTLVLEPRRDRQRITAICRRGQPMDADKCVQELLELDCLSPGFPDQLSIILGRRQFEEEVGELEPNDVERVIECLDKVPSFRQLETLSR